MIQKAIERLEYLTEIAPGKIEKLDEGQFSYKPSPEKWSRKEILGHLIDSAANNHQRFVRVQFEHSPTIWYDQNKWVETSRYSKLEKEKLISFWTAYNKYLASIIRFIPAHNLGKTCIMKDGSNVTLEFLIVDYVSHLEHHLKQIIDY